MLAAVFGWGGCSTRRLADLGLRRRTVTTRPGQRIDSADPHALLRAWIPTHVPAAYERRRAGRWIRKVDGSHVPDAADVTIETRTGFGGVETDGMIPVPVMAVRHDDTLAWVERYAVDDGWVATVRVRWVPADIWDVAATVIVDLAAPELGPNELVGPADAARICALAPSTISAHLHRGTIPPPVATVSNTPLWPRALILAWNQHRAQPGERSRPSPPASGRDARRRGSTTPTSSVSGSALTLADIDRILDRLDADVFDSRLDDEAGDRPGKRPGE